LTDIEFGVISYTVCLVHPVTWRDKIEDRCFQGLR
jgi:hypothetical protein